MWEETYHATINKNYTPIYETITTYIPQTSDGSIFTNNTKLNPIKYPENATFNYPSPTTKTTIINNSIILFEIFVQNPNLNTPHTNTVIKITDDTKISHLTLVNSTPFGGIPVWGKIVLFYYPNKTVQIITPNTQITDMGIINYLNFLNSPYVANNATYLKYLLSRGSTVSYVPDTSDGSIFTNGKWKGGLESTVGVIPTNINNDDGKVILTNQNGNIILTEIDIIDPNKSQSTFKSQILTNQNLKKDDPYVYYGFIFNTSQNHVPIINDFTAYLNVPKGPTSKFSHQYISYWTGIGSSDGNMLIQPVLEWDHQTTGKYWIVRSWSIGKNEKQDHWSNGTRVFPGDKLKLELHYSKTTKRWTSDITDLSSPSQPHNPLISNLPIGNTNVEVFSAVLEGRKLIKSEGETSLPDSATFYDYSSDTPINPSPFVDPDAKKTYRNIYIDIRNNPLQVKLSTGKGLAQLPPQQINQTPLKKSNTNIEKLEEIS